MTAELRAARDALVADRALAGREFGAALSDALDDALRAGASSLARPPGSWALVAMGSYARRELCPASDVDVMLLLGRGGDAKPDDAAALWYPLWDSGFVLGQSERTLKEALALADSDLQSMTALLDVRLLAGDAALAADLEQRVRALVPRRRERLLDQLAAASSARMTRPGPIAEMLEPNVKDGSGGLRDIQAAGWLGWTLTSGATTPALDGRSWEAGTTTLVDLGYLLAADRDRLAAGRDRLLESRVALHRVTRGRGDQLSLQDQDEVAAVVGAPDADQLVRSLGEASRTVAWIVADLFVRLRDAARGPRNRSVGVRALGDGVILRDSRVDFDADVPLDAVHVLRVGAHAARLGSPIARDALVRIGGLGAVSWDQPTRDAFIELLAGGRGAIPVFESLDHVGALVRILPEWEHIRARPQRNAYHRFTVDRHSLEAVAECMALLEDESVDGAFDSQIANRARRDLLVLAALLHDVAKGRDGDHSVLGAEVARGVAVRIGLGAHDTDDLAWLVANHLLLADTATRRDLSDEATIARFGAAVGTVERLDLLFALTVGDSRATGPAAWNTSKAALLRELYARTAWLLEGNTAESPFAAERRDELSALIGGEAAAEFLDAMPGAYAGSYPAETMAEHRQLLAACEAAVEWAVIDQERVRCTLVAPDRTGLLALAAGVLALSGLDVQSAAAYSHASGMALEVFTCGDPFERVVDESDRMRIIQRFDEALAGNLALDSLLRDRTRRYRSAGSTRSDRNVTVHVDSEASPRATVVEVYAPDDVGLLALVASVFADLDLDVSLALVSTIGDRVVDVFYLCDAAGKKLVDRHVAERLRATLLARLTSEVTLS